MALVFATGNKHKLEEVKRMFPEGTALLSLADIGVTEDIPEPFDTMEENAFAKVDYLFSKYNKPCFADDSGLEVFALDMRPGVFSARYAGPEKDDIRNRLLILEQMKGKKDRRARFRAVIAYRDKDHRVCFEGIVNGRIDEKETGSGGFGYDPIFIPDGYDSSFGVLPAEIKQRISHRSEGINKLVVQLKEWKVI